MRFQAPATHEVAMSDRGNDLTGGSDGGADASAPAGVFDDIPVDDIDALEPASDLDDVAFGLDLNPDDVDLTFDPEWKPSVANRSWGDDARAPSWADPSLGDEPSAPSWSIDRGWGD